MECGPLRLRLWTGPIEGEGPAILWLKLPVTAAEVVLMRKGVQARSNDVRSAPVARVSQFQSSRTAFDLASHFSGIQADYPD